MGRRVGEGPQRRVVETRRPGPTRRHRRLSGRRTCKSGPRDVLDGSCQVEDRQRDRALVVQLGDGDGLGDSGSTTIDTSPVVEFVPSLTVYCTGTVPVNVAVGAVYVNEPVAEFRSLIVPSPAGTIGLEKVYVGLVLTSWMRSNRLGTVVEGPSPSCSRACPR